MGVIEFLIFCLIAFVLALVAEHIVGAGPYGILGTTVLGALAILIFVGLLHLVIPGDPTLAGVPLISSLLWCIVADLIWLKLIAPGINRRGRV